MLGKFDADDVSSFNEWIELIYPNIHFKLEELVFLSPE